MKSIITLMNSYLNHKGEIISISGSSGSGKTTLALQLISNLIRPYKYEKCLWIQASESFPKRRLDALLSGKLTQKKYVLNNTFIFPSDHTISSFKEQHNLLTRISSQMLPPETKSLVIDNISHHLRFYLSLQKDISQRSKLVNRFFNELLFPLVMRCKREEIILIMIHEVSQDPHSGEVHPFYHKLFNRIETISFSFQGSIHLGTQLLNITPRGTSTFQFLYKLKNEGVFTCCL